MKWSVYTLVFVAICNYANAQTNISNDISVAFIQRFPLTNSILNSTNPKVQGWPQLGSSVTWRANIKNWNSSTYTNISYRWKINSVEVENGSINLPPSNYNYTSVDLIRPWNFERSKITFELDISNSLNEISKINNTLSINSDSISLSLYVEKQIYDYFHTHQNKLNDGANGFEDWAQRQARIWNQMFSEFGVKDRIRIDKVYIAENNQLPLGTGGNPYNFPNLNDKTTDLQWGYPSSLLNGSNYTNFTTKTFDNPFYYEGSLLHELGHARYLIDNYSYNIRDLTNSRSIYLTHNGTNIVGTPFLPKTFPWFEEVYSISSFDENLSGLMSGNWSRIDKFSVMALNQIFGFRTHTEPPISPKIGEFNNLLPKTNIVKILDFKGSPISGADVQVFYAKQETGMYSRKFLDTPDLNLQSDSSGEINLGSNPFGGPIKIGFSDQTNGVLNNNVSLLKISKNGETGYSFIRSGYFIMDFWRGNTNASTLTLPVAMIGNTRKIASVKKWNIFNRDMLQVTFGGDTQPLNVLINGNSPESTSQGSFWFYVQNANSNNIITANWPGGPVLSESSTSFINEWPSSPLNEDVDNDGLDDNWEKSFLDNLSLDPFDDLDSDGINNYYEFVQQLDPFIPNNDKPDIKIISISPSILSLQFASLLGRKYEVWKTDSLSENTWSNISSQINGIGGLINTNILINEQKAFFKVKSSP